MGILYHMIRFTPFYITLFWALVFLLQSVRRNRARFVLGIFMLAASIIYFSHAVFFEGDKRFYLKIDALYAWAALSVFPLYYLYIRLMTQDIRCQWKYLWHFLPALITAGLLQYALLHSTPAEKMSYLQNALIQRRIPQATPTGPMVDFMIILYFSSRIIFGLQAVFYTFAGLSLIKKYNHRIADFYSDLSGKKLVWLELITWTFVLVSIASMILNLLGRRYFVQHHHLAIPSMLFGTLFFIIGFLGNKQNYSITRLAQEELEEDQNESITEQKKNQQLLKEQLLTLMEKEQPFLDKNLRITSLTQKLFTNRSYLSAVINEQLNMNFNDFINRYRVEFAKNLMISEHRKGNRVSIASISESAGFGSVSSFLRAFKQFEGKTVAHFRKNL